MKKLILLIILLIPYCLFSQQIADTSYQPVIQNPMYAPGKGPVVFIDEGHHNFHTKDGRYKAFANLLERDGYDVKAYSGAFRANKLKEGKILVIANALNEQNVNDWFVPVPSAFTKDELDIVGKWVQDGGSLFLIADHMPMSGAAIDLAAVFGFECTNGFAIDTLAQGPDLFTLEEKTLVKSIVTIGRGADENVDKIVTFTGQGFKIPPDANPVLILNKNFVTLLPDTAWAFKKDTPKINSGGYAQGAYKNYGKGKVAVFGEAAMFTAQLAGPQKNRMGMNSEFATQNYKLLLNLIHWLDWKLE